MSVLINELEIVPPPAEDAAARPDQAAPPATAAEESQLTAADVGELLDRAAERCLRVWAH
jgi:hypothetical protein